MTLCLGSSVPPTGTSPSLGPKQATQIAQVKNKTETETKAHILAAQRTCRLSLRQPWEPAAGGGAALAHEVRPSEQTPSWGPPRAGHLLLPGLQALPQGTGGGWTCR